VLEHRTVETSLTVSSRTLAIEQNLTGSAITQPRNQVAIYLAALIFAAASVAASNYFLNDFYVAGAAMLDSGWYAYLFAHSLHWPPLNPPAIGGNYFETSHFSPILLVFGCLHAILGRAGVNVPAPIYFSIIQGAWVGTIPLAIFLLLRSGERKSTLYLVVMSVVAVVSGFGAISLAALFLPHIEIGIPACLLMFFALYGSKFKRASVVPLVGGLFIREDAGLHYFGFLISLSCALYLSSKSKGARSAAKDFLVLSICCVLYGLGVIALQKLFFANNDALVRVYTGTPPYQHLTWTFLKDRSWFMLHHRLYILAPLALLVIISAALGDMVLFAGTFAVMPWLMFSFAALSFQAGTLTYYYSFPFIVSVAWPAVSARVAHLAGIPRRQGIYGVSLLLLAVSSLLFVREIPPQAPMTIPGFGFDWYGKIADNQSALHQFLSSNPAYRFLVDDSVASLNTESVTSDQWRYSLAFPRSLVTAADGIIFQPGSWLAETAERIATEAKFVNRCQITRTNFIVMSRYKDLAECEY
jgi:hypothetical protein